MDDERRGMYDAEDGCGWEVGRQWPAPPRFSTAEFEFFHATRMLGRASVGLSVVGWSARLLLDPMQI